MNLETQRALAAINRHFYRAGAESFSATREAPWPGWRRVRDALTESHPAGPLAVLDVGCGNGRFGAWLAAELPARRAEISYLGLDAAPRLLEIAAERCAALGRVETGPCDFADGQLEPELRRRRFDLVVAFGVLHHVPGFASRRQLLASLAEALAPGGLLAITVWPFATRRRFLARVVPWEEHARYADAVAHPIDTRQLEPGDHLLPWGDGELVRYCHHTDADELARLLADLPLTRCAAFTADGRDGDQNHYALLRSPAEGSL